MKSIRSPENPGYRDLLRLARSARLQRQARVALLEGEHLCTAYAARYGSPRRLVVTEAALASAAVADLQARDPALETWVLAPSLFKALAQTDTPAGIIAEIEVPKPEPGSTPLGTCLLLEDIQDPGNLGVLLRIAAAAGLRTVWLSPHCAYVWSGKVLRAGQGAHFSLELVEAADLLAVARDFAGLRMATVVRGGASLFDTRLDGPIAFLFGNEGAGLSQALATMVDRRLTIPMPGAMESLNVASAAAIVVFEKLRQDACCALPSAKTGCPGN